MSPVFGFGNELVIILIAILSRTGKP